MVDRDSIEDLVEALHGRGTREKLDFAHRAWILRQPPVRRERLVERLQEQCTVTAAVPHHHDSLIRVPFANRAQYVRHACEEILERLAPWETHELRRRKPAREQLRPERAHLFMGMPLPIAVVHIIEIIENRGREAAAGRTDRRSGLQAASQRTRVDRHRLPPGCHALRGGLRLPDAEVREVDIPAAAKAFRGHAFDVAVPNHQEPCHVCCSIGAAARRSEYHSVRLNCTRSAAQLSTTCSTFVAPMIGTMPAGWCRSQASMMAAGEVS